MEFESSILHLVCSSHIRGKSRHLALQGLQRVQLLAKQEREGERREKKRISRY